MNPTIIALSLAALCGAAAPAAAQSGPEERTSVSVRIADLDLASAHGRRAFESRVRLASAKACSAVRSNNASDEAAIAACRERFVRDARLAARKG